MDTHTLNRTGRMARRCRRAAYGGAAVAGASALFVPGVAGATAPDADEVVGEAMGTANSDAQAFVTTYVVPAMLVAIGFVGVLGIGWVVVNKIYRKFRGSA